MKLVRHFADFGLAIGCCGHNPVLPRFMSIVDFSNNEVTLILLAFLKLRVLSVTDKCIVRNSVDFASFRKTVHPFLYEP